MVTEGIFLKREDMETPRSPRDLSVWVQAKIFELAQSKKDKAYLRSRACLPKKLLEEVRPFALFANLRFGSDDVRCIPNLGNENFDGRIEFADQTKEAIFVEITYAKNGHDERLRLTVLNEKGSVNLLGTVNVTGTHAAGNRRVEVKNEAVSHQATLKSGLSLVKKVLTNKSKKRYGPQYALVIVVDDYLAFHSEEGKAALRQYAVTTISSLPMDFGAIYLLGSSGEYLERIYGVV